MVKASAHWPKKLPKRYETKRLLTVRDLADIAKVSRIAINRYWIRQIDGAEKMGEHKNDPWAVQTADVINFLNKMNETTTES